MNKIKICYLVSSLANEGPVNVLYNILAYIDKNKFDISIITFVSEKETTRINDFRKLGFTIVNLKSKGILKYIRQFYLLKSAVKEESPDILHAHCPRSLFFMALLPKKFKKGYTIHIYPGLQQHVLYGKLFGSMVILFSKYFIKKIDLPIACAENVKDEFLKNENVNLKAIPNGSECDVMAVDNALKNNIRKRLGLKQDVVYFIFIGRFSSEKNPDFLVNQFKKLADTDIGLIMLGDGYLWNFLNNIKSANVVMPGFVENVNDYILAADYYVSASDVEGLANTLLETMSRGLPFLLSNIPSHREVKNKSDDFMGLTFENKNENDFMDKLNILLSYPKENASSAVRDCYHKFYTAKRMSKEYQASYIDLFS